MLSEPIDLFIYGTLLDPDIFAAVSGKPVHQFRTSPASRASYRVTGMLGWPYPMVVAAEGLNLQGRVFHDLDPESFRRIHFYEGPEYDLVRVQLKGERGPVSAQIFEGASAQVSDDQDWCLETWQQTDKPRLLEILQIMMPKFEHLDFATFNAEWDRLEEER